MAKNSDLIICVSRFSANELSEHYGISDERVKVIHHGVDNFIYQKDFSNLKKFNRPTILYVGHRLGYKNFNILPQAIRIVKNSASILSDTGLVKAFNLLYSRCDFDPLIVAFAKESILDN